MPLVSAATGMDQKDCTAQARSCRVPTDAGIAQLVTIGDDASVGAAVAGPKLNLFGGRVAEVRPEMINDLEAEAATQEDPATAVQAPLGRPLQQPPDFSEQRGSQSLATRWVAMLVRWRL